MNIKGIFSSSIAYIFYFILASACIKVAIKMIDRSEARNTIIAVAVFIASLAVGAVILYLIFKNRKMIWSKFRSLKKATRIILWGSSFWFISVLSFVLLFNPYGYMSDEEWIEITKIITLPPLFISLGYLSYTKMVKNDTD